MKTIAFFILFVGSVIAQVQNPIVFPGVPTGACGPPNTAVNQSNGDFYTCAASAWVKVGSSGGGLPALARGQLVVGTSGSPIAQDKFIVDVRDYSGADWCSQVNAADVAFSGVQAILNVPSSMSGLTACTTTITLHSSHTLSFGQGSFDLGTQSGKAGIVIPTATSNVDIGGVSRSVTSIYYTSANIGGNAYPMGSGIAVGTNAGCTSIANAANYIHIHDIHLIDRNTGSALNGSTFNPSGITGICDNNVTIENNTFTDIKGNAAITLTGSWSTFTTASNYMDRNNIFDGTAAGNGGEFTADNSANWTNFYMTGNIISDYACGIGVSHGFNGIISNNIVDLTLKAKNGNCPAIALGSGDDTIGDLQAINNIVTLDNSIVAAAQIGIGFFPKATLSGSRELTIMGNIIRRQGGSSITGISINSTNAGTSPPSLIVRNNFVTADIPTAVTGVFNNVEVSNNSFEGTTGTIPLFNCTGTTSIQSGGSVRVYGNRHTGASAGGVASNCTDASFSTRQFQEWNNTIKDGNPNSYGVTSGFLGIPSKLSWTPGTIAAYSSTSDQVVTVTQAIPGDTVKLMSANGTTNWISLPAGVIASGAVTSANTVTFNITNTTASAVNVNSGSQIQSFVFVDRPPNSDQSPAYSLNNSITLGASPNTSAQIGPVTARTSITQGTPSVIIQEEAGFNPLEIHSAHQQGIQLYVHDGTLGTRAPAIWFQRSRGTQTSPAAVTSGDLIGVQNYGGFDGSVYAADSLIKVNASENWNGTSHGSSIVFAVIPNTTTAAVNSLLLNNDKSISIVGQLSSSLATGTAPFSITSTTPVANLTTVPATYNHSGTQQTATHLIQDSCTLGTDCGVTLTGSAVFTNSTSYTCVCDDATAINSCRVNQTSGSAFTITGTGTDVIRYVCTGN